MKNCVDLRAHPAASRAVDVLDMSLILWRGAAKAQRILVAPRITACRHLGSRTIAELADGAKKRVVKSVKDANADAVVAEATARGRIAMAGAAGAEADAVATKTTERRAKEDRQRAEEERQRKEWVRVLAVLAGALLGVDWVWHDYEPVLKWRIKRKMLTPRAEPSAVAQRLPVPGSLTLADLVCDKPTMLLGPTGSGKSSLLECLAAEAAAPSPADASVATVPTVLVRIREGTGVTGPIVAQTDAQAASQLDAMAAEIFRDMGFPQRRSLVSRTDVQGWISAILAQFGWTGPIAAHVTASSVPRTVQALRLLFSACRELREARTHAGLPAQVAAPVVMIDGVHDLVKTERLADVGGRELFRELAVPFVFCANDLKAVRALAAGSSDLAAETIATPTIAWRHRWNVFELADPSKDVVLGALRSSGLSPEEAERVVAACGTRLRLLSPLLARSPSDAHAPADWLARTAATSTADLENALDAIRIAYPNAFPAVTTALDTLALLEDTPAPPDIVRPHCRLFPASLRQLNAFSTIFYVRPDVGLSFQSMCIRHAWQSVRSKFVTP